MTNQGSTRIKGNALLFKLGDSDGTDYWADCSSVVLENADDNSGVLTFEDAANGGARAWQFTLSGIQSTASSSFWRYIWNNTGEEVAFTYAPHGNETPSADQPHFVGMCKVGPKPSVGGDADREGEYTFETRLDVTSGPTLDDGTVTP